jgi:DNA-binding NtrC family response regulator
MATGCGDAVAAGKNRLLIVDDERVISDSLALIFSNAGYEARAVSSQEDAMALLLTAEWIPELAVIDVRLPGIDGIDLAILIKAEYPLVHDLLFSGQSTTTDLLDLEGARSKGHVFDVLAKPIHPSEFLGLVSKTLVNRQPGNVPAEPLSEA